MKNLNQLIPRDKYDMDTINKLKTINHEEIDISPIIDDLFEWIQDINWPIAQELCKVLAKLRPDDIIPRINKILKNGCEDWQYSCIHFLIPELPIEQLEQIKPELLRIINNPNQNEINCEVDQVAKQVYDRLF